jgi:hypothetical protein
LLHRGRIIVRSDRPSSIVTPNRNITKVEIGDAAVYLTIVRPAAAAPPRRPEPVEQQA